MQQPPLDAPPNALLMCSLTAVEAAHSAVFDENPRVILNHILINSINSHSQNDFFKEHFEERLEVVEDLRQQGYAHGLECFDGVLNIQ